MIMQSELFKKKYRINSSRLKDWDYSRSSTYFITICTQDKKCYLGNIVNQKMELSKIGEIAQKYWIEIPKHYSFVELDECIVMPNHIHCIIKINKPDSRVETTHWDVSKNVVSIHQGEMTHQETSQWVVSTSKFNGHNNPKLTRNSLGSIINQYKSFCTKQIRKLHDPNFQWQSRFYDHIVRDIEDLNRIRQYIIDNLKDV